MKKITIILLCVVMLVGITACGIKENTHENSHAPVQLPPIVANNITDSENMMKIETSIGTLYYPEKWKDSVQFQVADDQVVATYHDVPLFTLYFGGKHGDLYGTVTKNGEKISLRYKMHDLDSTNEEFETMCAMQEDINVIFQYLIQEGKLKEA